MSTAAIVAQLIEVEEQLRANAEAFAEVERTAKIRAGFRNLQRQNRASIRRQDRIVERAHGRNRR